jgi:hypothetical protein
MTTGMLFPELLMTQSLGNPHAIAVWNDQRSVNSDQGTAGSERVIYESKDGLEPGSAIERPGESHSFRLKIQEGEPAGFILPTKIDAHKLQNAPAACFRALNSVANSAFGGLQRFRQEATHP